MVTISKDEIEAAKSVDLLEVARSLGYTIRNVGHYHTLKEMDSIRIYNKRTWYRWSDAPGGSQIDFLLHFTNMDFKESVRYLLSIGGVEKNILPPAPEYHPEEKKDVFSLPAPSSDNMRLKGYLTKNRMISEKTVDKFIDLGLIYESTPYHNIVFVGKDSDGTVRFASLRGTYDGKGKAFKCDVRGNDKHYGFHLSADGSDTIRVFEGAIDLMSFYDATGLDSDHLLALGMTADVPLERYLSDHPEIKKIYLNLDNDNPGIEAATRIEMKYETLGYTVKNLGSPKGYKDYNEWLIATKRRQSLSAPEHIRK